MDISFFRRGVKLKRRPAYGPVEDVSSTKRVVLLPGYEFQKPYKQVVKVQDVVGAGDVIATTDSGDEIHAPMSGEIKPSDDVLCVDGRRLPSVVIEGDTKSSSDPESSDHVPPKDAEAIGDMVRKAGVVQGTFAARPLGDLVEEAKGSKTEHMVVRFFDPDPFLGSLEALTSLIDENTDELKTGVEATKKLLGASKVHFVLEEEQSAAGIERYGADNQVTVRRVDAYDYPSMTDALLAKRILGSESNIDPSNVHTSGVFVLDLNTVLDVARAVSKGQGVASRIISVLGSGVAKALRVSVGTPIGDILEAAGLGSDHAKVILGGPLTGQACHSLDYPLTKDISGITVQTSEELELASDHQCLNCGLCNMTCPMRLVPGMLSRYCEYDQFDDAADANLFSCIECGCCAYVCPAERSMVQLFSHGKKEFLATEREES